MKIHAMSRDKGGCHFYRIRTPLHALQKLGHITSWSDRISGAELAETDVLVVQFINGEKDLAFWETVATLPRTKRPLMVYEVDDDLFSIDGVITPEVAGGKPVLWADPATQARVKRSLELADLVTVTTPYLAEVYQPYARKIAVLPNSIPDWLLDLPAGQPSKRFTVGWVCSHSHLIDARKHYDALQAFMRHHPDALFHWVGPKDVHAFPPFQQKVTPWQKDVTTYLTHLPDYGFDVGIAPLADNVFNRGKSGIKADEYAAIGIPTLASDFPQYQDVIIDGVTGYLIKRKTQWASMLRLMKDYPDVRRMMGKAAKDLVSMRTISKRAHLWIQAYEEAMS